MNEVQDGFVLANRRATSHEQYVHPTKPGRVTLRPTTIAEMIEITAA